MLMAIIILNVGFDEGVDLDTPVVLNFNKLEELNLIQVSLDHDFVTWLEIQLK